jgi:small G protein signaling modulator 3
VLEALTFQWFLSIFTDCLAAEALFRIWDVILCLVGSPFLFQVALALLKLNEKALLSCKSAAAVYSYLNSEMTHQGISIDGLIRESDSMKSYVKRKEVEAKREKAIEKELGEMSAEDAAKALESDPSASATPIGSDEDSREPSTKSILEENKADDRKDSEGEGEPSTAIEEAMQELLVEPVEAKAEHTAVDQSADLSSVEITPSPSAAIAAVPVAT